MALNGSMLGSRPTEVALTTISAAAGTAAWCTPRSAASAAARAAGRVQTETSAPPPAPPPGAAAPGAGHRPRGGPRRAARAEHERAAPGGVHALRQRLEQPRRVRVVGG